MGRARTAFVVVAVTAVLSGCPAVAEQGADRTVTPAPVPDTPEPLAPGVVPAGPDGTASAVDWRRLLAADRSLRQATSYRLVRRVTVAGPQGTMRVVRVRAVGPEGRILERMTVSGTGRSEPAVENSTVWVAGGTVATRTRLANGRTLVDRDLPGVPRRHRRGANLTATVLRSGSFRVRPLPDGGARLASTGALPLSLQPASVTIGSPRNVSARLHVTERGLIERTRVTYDATRGPAVVDVRVRHRVTDVGSVSVSRPSWVNASG